MSEFLRVNPPLSEHANRLAGTTDIPLASESMLVNVGDIRVIATKYSDLPVLWLAVIKVDETRGVAEVVVVQPDSILSDENSLILDRFTSFTGVDLAIWPHLVGTVWKDDLISKSGRRNLIGVLNKHQLLEIAKASVPEHVTQAPMPTGMRRGVAGIHNSPGFEKFIAMHVLALSDFGESVWETFLNVYLGSDIVSAVFNGNVDVLKELQTRNDFKVSKEDVRKCREEMMLSKNARPLIRDRRLNELLKVDRLVKTLPMDESLTILTQDEDLIRLSPVIVEKQRRVYELVCV